MQRPLHLQAPAMMPRPPSTADKRSHFTIKNLFLNGLFITVVFFLNKLGTPGSLLAYLCLFVMASRSTAGAIKAFSLGALIIVANSHLISINMAHSYLRFPLVLVAGLRIFWDARQRSPKVFFQGHLVALLMFAGVSLLCAFINQYFFMVSLLKIGVFTYGAYAIMVGSDASRTSGSDLTVWFCALVLFYVAGNFLAYGLGVGYTYHGRLTEAGGTLGLAGITNHPQTQGPLSAISAIYAFCVYLYTPYRQRWLMGLLVPILLVLCYMSAARTALFSVVLALGALVAFSFVLSGGHKRVRLNVSPVKMAIICFMSGMGLLFIELFTGGIFTQKISDFALKSIRDGSSGSFSFSTMFSSRMPLIEQSIYLFREKPLTGIGFGTMLDPAWAANASILSAPTEKGFLPTAILEETGIFGALCFAAFLCLFFSNYWRKRNIVAIGVMACFVLLNLGEMMFFALGGMGAYCWSMIGAGIALGDRVAERS